MENLARLHYEQAVEEYDEEMVNLSISLFLEETYEELKQKVPEAYEKHDHKEMKAIVHKFKTTAKYMGAYECAELCGQMQKSVEEGKEDLPLLCTLYPLFMSNLDGLRDACLRQSNAILSKGAPVSSELNHVEEEPKEEDGLVDEDNGMEFDGLRSAMSIKKYSQEMMHNYCKTPREFRKATYSFSETISSFSPFSKKVPSKSKIQLRYEEAIHKFEVDIVNVIIQTFVTEEYTVMKANLKKAYNSKDIKELQSCLHTMKLKAKYICAEEFAEDCICIENCIKENKEDLAQLAELFPVFMEHFDMLYTEVQQCYEKIQNTSLEMTPTLTSKAPIPKPLLARTRNSQHLLPSMNQKCMKQGKKHFHHKTFSNWSKLREMEELNSKVIVTPTKKSLFDIDLTFLQTNAFDTENTFDEDIDPLFAEFREAIDENDYEELIECLNDLKENVVKYKFTLLMPFIEDWKMLIANDAEENSLDISYEDIEHILNQMKALMKEKREAFAIQETPEYQSKKISGTNSPMSTLPKSSESILEELKPISISCFFKANETIDEFEKQIKQFSHEEKREKTDFLKNLPKPLKNMNPFIDCNYPFKEESFSCMLF